MKTFFIISVPKNLLVLLLNAKGSLGISGKYLGIVLYCIFKWNKLKMKQFKTVKYLLYYLLVWTIV